MRDFAEELESLKATTGRFAMATLVAARGGSPRPLGSKMFVGEDGRVCGAVSIGGCVDARLVHHAQRVLRAGGSELVTVTVDDDEAVELGLTCGADFQLIVDAVDMRDRDPVLDVHRQAHDVARAGGEAFIVRAIGGGVPVLVTSPGDARAHGAIDAGRGGAYTSADGAWFVEHVAPPATLVIVGATDVALALTRFAKVLGFHVVVADGRERPATRDRFPEPVHVGMPSDLVRPYLRPGTYLVLASHDYRYDLPILREALRAPLAFVGMLSSRKRADAVKSLLRDAGLGETEIGRLHAPVGLPIGGREAEEIALSIAAQLVAIREGKPIARREPEVVQR